MESWNESREEEGCKEKDCEKSGVEEGGEKGSGQEARTEEGSRHERRTEEQWRTDHLEFQAVEPPYARRFRRHGRRHVDPDRARRPPHSLARARKRAEEFHRRRRLRSAQAQGRCADRPAAGPHALQFIGDLREYHGGRLPDAKEGTATGRHGAV